MQFSQIGESPPPQVVSNTQRSVPATGLRRADLQNEGIPAQRVFPFYLSLVGSCALFWQRGFIMESFLPGDS